MVLVKMQLTDQSLVYNLGKQMNKRKWTVPGSQQPMPDTTRPAKPMGPLPGGNQLKEVCSMCGKDRATCGCKPNYR
jgi:hypothetical protein